MKQSNPIKYKTIRFGLCLLLCFSIGIPNVFSQQNENFKIIKLLKTTSLKNQQSSGTCWSFATTSFIETEAIRLGNEPVILSPIFYVAPTYISKAEKFIENKGKGYFGGGDLTFSVLEGYKKYGAIPEEVYSGRIKEDKQHDHLEMDNLLQAMVESVGKSGYSRIKPNSWKKSVEAVLKSYLGEAPETFTYKGKQYTPKSFSDKFIGIDSDNYIEITSYSHHKFYDFFALNIVANWMQKKYLNLPISDFEKTINYALENGFSLAWDGDSTESGFNREEGIAELPLHQEKITITQEMRQASFEDGSTDDNHNMHIIGIAEDSHSNKYYIIKNSEGNNAMGGYIYMSKNYLLLKTISVLVNKDALPKDIKSKLPSKE